MDYTEDKVKRVFQIILGVCCCAGAYKFFLAPAGLYNGGFTGIAQIIRNLLKEFGGFNFRSDPTGIIVWCLNVPLMIIGYRILGRMFMIKTIAVITMQSMLMTVIKGPEAQLISDQALNCLCGGALNGYGIGLLLRSGASGGGSDIVGMVAVKKKPEFSVGMISMSINILIFAYAAVTRSFEIAAYSAVYSLITSMMIDRTHYQTTKVVVFVVSKIPVLGPVISAEMHRGVTTWKAEGQHSHQPYNVHMVVMNRYELQNFRLVLRAADPKAFIWTVKLDQVMGNFSQHLGV